MQRRFSFAFVTITAIIALTFGTLAGGIAGGFAALVLDPDSPTGERTAENSDNPSPNPDSASAPSPASSGDDARSNDQSGSGEPVSHKERYSLIADIVEEVSPAVVTVVNEQRMVEGFFDQEDGFEDDP